MNSISDDIRSGIGYFSNVFRAYARTERSCPRQWRFAVNLVGRAVRAWPEKTLRIPGTVAFYLWRMERGWCSASVTLFFAIKSSSLAATLATVVGSKEWEEKKKGKMQNRDGKHERRKASVRLIKMQYLQAVPVRITRLPPSLSPLFLFCLHPPLGRREEERLRERRSTPAVAPTANGEIMIKPTSFQWNDGNYRAGCSRIPVFVHYSEAAYKCLARKVRSRWPDRAYTPSRTFYVQSSFSFLPITKFPYRRG